MCLKELSEAAMAMAVVSLSVSAFFAKSVLEFWFQDKSPQFYSPELVYVKFLQAQGCLPSANYRV